MLRFPVRTVAACALATSFLAGCASGPYTGPVEVTRFIGDAPMRLGEGTITIVFPEEMENDLARNAFASAVADELGGLGYRLVMHEAGATQIASVRTSRNPLAVPQQEGGPVSVGVGGGTGGFGSGVGVGVGINLGGGGDDEPRVVTELSVRISGLDGATLWEGRAQQPVSISSPYSDVEASARTLAAALFAGFPGGNGETVIVEIDELQER